jgi:hypothetical protein
MKKGKGPGNIRALISIFCEEIEPDLNPVKEVK